MTTVIHNRIFIFNQKYNETYGTAQHVQYTRIECIENNL